MTANRPETERRQHPRQAAGHVHACIPPGEAFSPMELAARDLTAAGVGLLLVGQVGVGTVLPLRLSNPGRGGSAVDVRGRVVYAQQQPDGRWLTGCAFERPLTAEELQALL